MNSCLFKTLLIAIIVIGLFFAFPYLKKRGEDELQEASTKATIVKKFIKYLNISDHKPQDIKPQDIHQEIKKEITKNDDTKNKKTGK